MSSISRPIRMTITACLLAAALPGWAQERPAGGAALAVYLQLKPAPANSK